MLVVDAGGGTIDISSYTVLEDGLLKVEELFQPKCQFVYLWLIIQLLELSRKAYYKAENSLQRGQGRWPEVGSGVAHLLYSPLNHNQRD